MNLYFCCEEFSTVNVKGQQIDQDQNNFENAVRDVVYMRHFFFKLEKKKKIQLVRPEK